MNHGRQISHRDSIGPQTKQELAASESSAMKFEAWKRSIRHRCFSGSNRNSKHTLDGPHEHCAALGAPDDLLTLIGAMDYDI